jgi:UDP-N-acetylmuramoyl-L-alanyl-D-glutamate--2,6-diaminopimelate ligase
MKLAQLFSVYKQFKMGDEPMREVTGLSIDSRQIQSGQVFVAIRGQSRDSHDYIKEVCAQAIAGVVVEDASNIPKDFRGGVLVVPNSREALVKLAGRFFGNPADHLFCVGVTGTNGKTSTTYMVESILNHFGMKTGVLGTINHHIGDKIWESELTTPDAITLQKRLREFVALGAKAAAFEISSHAIDQGRAAGLPLSCMVFTNLTRDHLDYHKTMENYFATKEKLFREVIATESNPHIFAIINNNDEWGRKIEVASHVRKVTYGESQSDFQFQILETKYSGTRFHLKCSRGEVEVKLQLPGRHNVYNAVAAIAVGIAAGASLENCIEGIQKFKGVPGRLEKVPSANDKHVFVDYAHTDDALKTVLTILREIRTQAHSKNKIITVFGCGGDRDKGKRPLMAKAAVEGSDTVFVTSDNPRTEEPMTIIQEILSSVSNSLMGSKVFVEVDRREAIRQAIEMARPNDVVLIAGKGHETYQIIGEKKYDFSDFKVAGEILNVL